MSRCSGKLEEGVGFCGAGALLGCGTWHRIWGPNAGSPEHPYEHGVWKEMRARCVFCIFKTKYLEKQNVQAHLLKPGILSSLGILAGSTTAAVATGL